MHFTLFFVTLRCGLTNVPKFMIMEQNNTKRRGYAVGNPTFEWHRIRGSVYIDKTAYVYRMVSTDAVNFFLSRPRRFGKSMLVDTLRCYFEGRKELFEGLAIYDLEKEWKKYPVIRLDLSNGKYFDKDLIHSTLDTILRQQEKKFGLGEYKDSRSYDSRMIRMIETAFKQTGEQVVVLIDEYDAPMLDSIDKPELQGSIREHIRNLFSPLKAQAQYLRFVFLTGISKFSQLSVFSELNNLQNLTFDPAYEAICGITEEELLTQLKPDIKLLTENMNAVYGRWGIHYEYDDIVAKLKEMYDGYHFTKLMKDIYCPWSLFSAFFRGDIEPFWFSTGTPSMLFKVMQQHQLSIPQIQDFHAPLDRFDAPTERITDPIPVLFQSGYLTLKDYNPIEEEYQLDFPNKEVREGFSKSLYKYYMGDYVGSQDALGNAFKRLNSKKISIDEFIECLRLWYAGIPYSITDRNQNEQLYQSLIYAALLGFGADVQAEDMTSDGRMDIALKMQDAIYIIELKYGKTAEEAADQVLTKDYAVRFVHDPRPVFAVGMNISHDRRTIDLYRICKAKE